MGALIMPSEQVIFSSKSQGTDPVLDRVAIHLDMTVMEEHLQSAPAVGDVGEMLTQPGLGRDPCPFLFQPVAERGNQRRCTRPADQSARFRIEPADFRKRCVCLTVFQLAGNISCISFPIRRDTDHFGRPSQFAA